MITARHLIIAMEALASAQLKQKSGDTKAALASFKESKRRRIADQAAAVLNALHVEGLLK